MVEGLRILGHSGWRGQGGGQGLDEDNEQRPTSPLSDQPCCCIHNTPYFGSRAFAFSTLKKLQKFSLVYSVCSFTGTHNVVRSSNWVTDIDQEVSGTGGVVCGKS